MYQKQDIDKVLKKYEDIINIPKDKMKDFRDPEHDWGHVLDVFEYAKQIVLDKDFNENINLEALIISVFWHDVGRVINGPKHEEISANMLKEELQNRDFDEAFIDDCYRAIINHRWDAIPLSIEGTILQDADKIAFLGKNRWESCIDNNYPLKSILNLLPKLKEGILKLDVSRKIYDTAIVDLVKLLSRKVFHDENI